MATPRIYKPILPSSRVAPIRTSQQVNKANKLVRSLVRRVYTQINNHMSMYTGIQDALTTNSDDGDAMTHDQLLIVLQLIRDAFTGIIKSDAFNPIVSEAFKTSYAHEMASVNNQLRDVLESAGVSLIEDDRVPDDQLDLLDVVITTVVDNIINNLRSTVVAAYRQTVTIGVVLALLMDTETTTVNKLRRVAIDELNGAARNAKEVVQSQTDKTLEHVNEVKAKAKGKGVDSDSDGEAEGEYGTALLWTSALLPTTRAWHASRHGNTYSSDEVQTFYSENGNRYNCHCSQSVVVTVDGEYIYPDITKTYHTQRDRWMAGSGGRK